VTQLKRRKLPIKRPAEFSAPAVWAALTALAVAFGVDPAKAAAFAGMAAALAPAIVTWLRMHGWL
jgi:hypothetical protein